MSYSIRILKEEEKDQVVEFCVSIFGEDCRQLAVDYTNSMFSSYYRRPLFMVAVKGEEIIGVAAMVECLFTINVWGLCWLGVHPDHRSKGIGAKRIKAREHEIKKSVPKRTFQLQPFQQDCCQKHTHESPQWSSMTSQTAHNSTTNYKDEIPKQ